MIIDKMYFMRLYGTIFLLFFSFVFFAQHEKQEMVWNENTLLSWKDFLGAEDDSSKNSAYSSCSFYCKGESNGDELKLSVYSTFDKYRSWKRKELESPDELLNHEQGHFDIAEIHARFLKQELMNHKFASIETIQIEIDSIVAYVDIQLEASNDLYDIETIHGISIAKQIVWDERIHSILEDFVLYKDTELSIDISYLR